MTSQAPKEERARERQETETERGPWRAAKTRAAERRARPGAPAPDPAQVQPPGRRPPRPPREAPEPAGTEPGGRVPAPSAPGLRLSSGAWQSLACHLPTSPGRLGDGRGRRSAGGSGRRPSEGPGRAGRAAAAGARRPRGRQPEWPVAEAPPGGRQGVRQPRSRGPPPLAGHVPPHPCSERRGSARPPDPGSWTAARGKLRRAERPAAPSSLPAPRRCLSCEARGRGRRRPARASPRTPAAGGLAACARRGWRAGPPRRPKTRPAPPSAPGKF